MGNERTDVLREAATRLLLELGYNRDTILHDVQTPHGDRADIVAYVGDEPRILVELKDASAMPIARDPETLRYDPVVRQAQATAHDLKARFFAVSDGSSALWFETDDASGRPHPVPAPVRPRNRGAASVDPGRFINNIFAQLRKLFRELGRQDPLDSIGTVLLARLLRERGQGALEGALRAGDIPSSLPPRLRQIGARTEPSRLAFEEALRLLDQVHLVDLPPLSVLQAIDSVLASAQMLRIPRWVADFMVRLCEISGDDLVLDLYGGAGDLLAACGIRAPMAHVRAVCPSDNSVLWTSVQHYLLRRDHPDILEQPPASSDERHHANRIVVAPPFGEMITLADQSQRVRSESAYLRLAIDLLPPGGRAVVLVPDSFLVTDAARRHRQMLLKRCRLESIISIGSFSTASAVRGSLVVLEKVSPGVQGEVFFGAITIPDSVRDSFDSTSLTPASDLLHALKHRQVMGDRSHNWHPLDRASADDLSPGRYLSEIWDAQSSFPLVPLHRLAQIRKGGDVRLALNERGESVIGPAAIRPLNIDRRALEAALPESIRASTPRVSGGDVVVNAIGTHRGAAAVVRNDLHGYVISRHVILLRPFADVNSDYLAAALNSVLVLDQIKAAPRGTIPALSLSQISALMIPIQPPGEQKKTADDVQVALMRVEEARARAESAESALRDLLNDLGRKTP
jgi:hypothetical protein